MNRFVLFVALAVITFSCGEPAQESTEPASEPAAKTAEQPEQRGPEIYASVKLTTDLSQLQDYEKEIIPKLIEAAQIMDDIFWMEAVGDKEALLNSIEDERMKRFAELNYGPWDRLAGDKPFIDGVEAKPLGAQFYPADMSKEEFEAAEFEGKNSQYTLVKRDEAGKLYAVPYHEAFKEQVSRAAELLFSAGMIANKAGDEELGGYLTARSSALLNDAYDQSDIAWLDMKNNGIDCIIGPIEHYEDKLYNIRTAHEAYVLVKDKAWSKRLERYVAFLPGLQKGLPVADEYKQESPGSSSQLNAYDVVYYAGDCNAGGKTIAVNLPNSEEIQTSKGTRRSQLKNAMKAKFDKIMLPLTDLLIDESQRKNVTFDAFFANTMFHEVAHGLGIKNTINGNGTVRDALKEMHSGLEEGKADILGLYMITELHKQGELEEGELMDNYVTFLAGIFRSVRFGASSAHGQANMVRFNFFQEKGAFERNEENGTYMVNMEKMQTAMTELSELILTLQGNGDYDGVVQLMKEKGLIGPGLQSDLDRLNEAGIPVDIVFEQGVEVLGL